MDVPPVFSRPPEGAYFCLCYYRTTSAAGMQPQLTKKVRYLCEKNGLFQRNKPFCYAKCTKQPK